MVVALDQQGRMGPVQGQAGPGGLGDQLVAVLGEDGQMGMHRPDRHAGEGQQIDAQVRQGGQQTVGFPRLVPDGGVEVVDA